MNNLNAFCLGFLIVCVLVSSVSAIKCYVCVGCNDPFDESNAHTATCAGSCVKTKTDGIVGRLCSPISGGDDCESKDGVEMCSCTNDLCNSASGMSFPLVGLCLSIFTMFLWVK
ncbi:uncharacterized protein LOC123555552 isoform X2 [Mercenaria mercenaria]|uniref:uncharacterized protein LOC123555552 isoform X2 n=1 Tax=Mercenaria mercenaria TaxID=6596 RepID=UPI001E1DE5F9|nr:uncharacterized protein LOC123555552 isoform X2 [Mercenaria mercenaria]